MVPADAEAVSLPFVDPGDCRMLPVGRLPGIDSTDVTYGGEDKA